VNNQNLATRIHLYHDCLIEDDLLLLNCPGCNIEPGQFHEDHCYLEQCSNCGRLSNNYGLNVDNSGNCPDTTFRIPWSGINPGVLDCRRLNLWTRHNGYEFVRCTAEDDGAQEDLNVLFAYGLWDRQQRRFVGLSADADPCHAEEPDQKRAERMEIQPFGLLQSAGSEVQ
jgi:hypothetical protein